MNAQFLRKENKLFRGTGGVSQENRACGFVPTFYDSYSYQVVISRFANGNPAPIHVLDGLPEDWVIGRDKGSRVMAVKDSVISGFVHQGRFYTRAQATQVLTH